MVNNIILWYTPTQQYTIVARCNVKHYCSTCAREEKKYGTKNKNEKLSNIPRNEELVLGKNLWKTYV